MDAHNCAFGPRQDPPGGPDTAPELDTWFAVSGDVDDFIYYGDVEKRHSEK